MNILLKLTNLKFSHLKCCRTKITFTFKDNISLKNK